MVRLLIGGVLELYCTRCFAAAHPTTRRIESRWCTTLWIYQSRCRGISVTRRSHCWQGCLIESQLDVWAAHRLMLRTLWAMLSLGISIGKIYAIVRFLHLISQLWQVAMTLAISIRCSLMRSLLRHRKPRCQNLLQRRLSLEGSHTIKITSIGKVERNDIIERPKIIL